MKIFIKKILMHAIFPLFLLLGLVVYNFFVDPYGVIREDISSKYTEPNQHYLKVKYITENPKKYNAFIFGNSRVGKINVNKIKDTANVWYNMTYSEGLPGEHLDDIKIFLKKNVKINKIVIGLDEISCFTKKSSHESQSLRKPYKNSFNPYISYFFLSPSFSLNKAIRDAKANEMYKEGMYLTIYETGSFFVNKKDTFIDNNKQLHILDKTFSEPYYWPSERVENFKECLEDIKMIKKICESKNIELEFFINPIYIKVYEKAVSKGFLKFINDLKKIVDFKDFNNFKEITTNNLNYYEKSHYRPIVGDFIIDRIFNK